MNRSLPDQISLPLLLSIGVGYWLLGAIGLGLAIPPGYASPVFPAAGLALAVSLRWGLRTLPAIWLGSFLLNTSLAWHQGHLSGLSILIACAIASGALLQSLAGYCLVKRHADKAWPRFESEITIFKFLLLGGTAACVVSATVGISTLVSLGIMPSENALFGWWTWYVGDTLGVFLATPLIWLAINRQEKGNWDRLKALILPVSIATLIASFAFVGVSKWENDALSNKISERGHEVAIHIKQRFLALREILNSLSRLIEVNPNLTPDQFEIFTQNTLNSEPDIFALSFNKQVNENYRTQFENSLKTLYPRLAQGIRERDAAGELIPAKSRATYVAVKFIAPIDDNAAALGFDIASSPLREKAITQAIDSREMTATAPVNLIQGTDDKQGMLLLLPSYPITKFSKLERSPIADGFVVSVIKIHEMLTYATQAELGKGAELTVTDITNPKKPSLLYTSSSQQGQVSELMQWHENLNMANRHWQITLKPTVAYLTEHRTFMAWIVGAIGLALAAVLQIMLLAVTGRSTYVRRKVEEQTLQIQKQYQALAKSTQEAQAANLAKSRFLATMSHELRTPLNGILGTAQLIQMDDIENRHTGQTELIMKSGHILLNLLNDLLDLSKIEAGKLELSETPFRPEDLVNDTLDLYWSNADKKGLELLADCQAIQHEWLIGDARRITQVLGNLVSNAIKFTDSGSVRIVVSTSLTENHKALLKLEVSDSGCGIPENKLNKLFKPFSQIDDSNTRQHGGTGLGLSIVHNLAQMMGGEVGVRSTVNQGSTFWWTARLKIQEGTGPKENVVTQTAEVPPQNSASIKGKNVLIVEDDRVNLAVIHAFLKKFELNVQHACDGRDALEKFKKNPPDLVLMDVQMPVMDGLETTRHIRSMETQGQLTRTPIVALTAAVLGSERQQCMDAGMDDFVSKPVNFRLFRQTLIQWLG